MYIFLDNWQESQPPSQPIKIPIPRHSKVIIGTPLHQYTVIIKSGSTELIRAIIISTPPSDKHFSKGDMVMFHIDNVLKFA